MKAIMRRIEKVGRVVRARAFLVQNLEGVQHVDGLMRWKLYVQILSK